jgi:hypothetical protein
VRCCETFTIFVEYQLRALESDLKIISFLKIMSSLLIQ